MVVALVVLGLQFVAACGPPKVNGYVIEPGADLIGADLTGADLSNADLTDVSWDEFTIDPDGWLK